MSRHLPSLNALRAFEAAGRHLSFSRAAEELRVTQGAVSRQVKALEEYLDVQLFHRLTRSLALTAQGEAYLPTMCEAFDLMEKATRDVLNRADRGVLTVSVLPTIAMRWLIARLPGFTDGNPKIEVRMITSIRPVDFRREDIDVAIRVGTLNDAAAGDGGARIDLVMMKDWAGVRACRLMPDILVPVCAAALVDGDPPLRCLEDIRHHTLLHTTTRARAWADWLEAAGLGDLDPGTDPSFGHFFMTLQAATEGRGIAIVPEILVAADLKVGNLVIPFDIPVESSGAYFLLCREHQWNTPKIRAFREWLLEEAEQAQEG